MEAASFTDSLTPEQVQNVLDVMNIPWREYQPNSDGWIDIHSDQYFEATGYPAAGYVGINILHGGFKDHAQGKTGDLVRQISVMKRIPDTEAIAWIRGKLGLNGAGPPELSPSQAFVKNAIADKKVNYAMMPESVLKSTELSAFAKVMYAAIQYRCGKGKAHAWPGMVQMQKDTGMTRSTIYKALKQLRDTGYLVEVSRGRGNAPKRYPLVQVDPNLKP